MLYRVAFISIQSGACVANPEYAYESDAQALYDEFFDCLDDVSCSHLITPTDANGRSFTVPIGHGLYVVVTEPVQQLGD